MSAVTADPQRPTVERLLRRAGIVLLWASVAVLGTFGTFFTLANYPLFGIGIVLVVLLLTTNSERKRRRRRRARERMHERERTRARDLTSG